MAAPHAHVDTERDVLAAAARGQWAEVRSALHDRSAGPRKSFALVNARDVTGFTMLHYAALAGVNDVCMELLDAGADVTTACPILGPPLLMAAQAGLATVVQRMLNAGALPHAVNFRGETALHVAAAHGRVDVLQELLRRGASVHARTNDAAQPLTPLAAARTRDYDVPDADLAACVAILEAAEAAAPHDAGARRPIRVTDAAHFTTASGAAAMPMPAHSAGSTGSDLSIHVTQSAAATAAAAPAAAATAASAVTVYRAASLQDLGTGTVITAVPASVPSNASAELRAAATYTPPKLEPGTLTFRSTSSDRASETAAVLAAAPFILGFDITKMVLPDGTPSLADAYKQGAEGTFGRVVRGAYEFHVHPVDGVPGPLQPHVVHVAAKIIKPKSTRTAAGEANVLFQLRTEMQALATACRNAPAASAAAPGRPALEQWQMGHAHVVIVLGHGSVDEAMVEPPNAPQPAPTLALPTQRQPQTSFIVMEWLHSSVAQMLFERTAGDTSSRPFLWQKRPDSDCPPMRTRLLWLRDAARGLAFMHQFHYVHGDLKADNLMIREDGIVKLVDVGEGRRQTIDPRAQFDTMTDEPCIQGSPAYMPPEVAAGHGSVSYRGDSFSFGVLMSEVVTCRRPWVDDAGNVTPNIAAEVTAGNRTPVRPIVKWPGAGEVPPAMLENIDGIMRHCWAQKSRDRPSAEEIASRLSQCVAQLLQEGED